MKLTRVVTLVTEIPLLVLPWLTTLFPGVTADSAIPIIEVANKKTYPDDEGWWWLALLVLVLPFPSPCGLLLKAMRFVRVQNNFAAGGDLRRGAVHLVIS